MFKKNLKPPPFSLCIWPLSGWCWQWWWQGGVGSGDGRSEPDNMMLAAVVVTGMAVVVRLVLASVVVVVVVLAAVVAGGGKGVAAGMAVPSQECRWHDSRPTLPASPPHATHCPPSSYTLTPTSPIPTTLIPPSQPLNMKFSPHLYDPNCI